jgi:hypothetical protein
MCSQDGFTVTVGGYSIDVTIEESPMIPYNIPNRKVGRTFRVVITRDGEEREEFSGVYTEELIDIMSQFAPPTHMRRKGG